MTLRGSDGCFIIFLSAAHPFFVICRLPVKWVSFSILPFYILVMVDCTRNNCNDLIGSGISNRIGWKKSNFSDWLRNLDFYWLLLLSMSPQTEWRMQKYEKGPNWALQSVHATVKHHHVTMLRQRVAFIPFLNPVFQTCHRVTFSRKFNIFKTINKIFTMLHCVSHYSKL